MKRRSWLIIVAVIISMLVACEEPDTTAPTVTVTYPAHATSVSEVVNVTCMATDNEGVENVELWVDGVFTGLTDHTEPYSFAWNTTQYVDGSAHVVTARAYDVNDNKGDSDPVTITIDQTDAYPTAVNIANVSYDTEILTITWSQSSDEDFASYELLYSLTEDGSQSSLGIFADIDSTTYTQTEFDPTHENWYWVKVADYWGLTSTGIGQTNSIDSVPIASFTVLPNRGTTATVFNFDAGESWDAEEATSQLRVRWDWESDGIWDTEYTTAKTVSHQFTTVGSYTTILEIQDSWGLTGFTYKTMIVNGTVVDIDGNVYETIQVGNQEWMAENLKVTHYQDGTAITHVTDATAWAALTSEAYCIYNNASNEVDTYGALYNWYAVNGDIDGNGTKDKEIAPTGWHVPSHTEWLTLVDYLDGNAIAGGKMKEAGTSHWLDPNTGATNESGLTALPGGTRIASGNYSGINSDGYFWSSTEYTSYAWYRNLISQQGIVTVDYVLKGYGFSVRCVKD